MNLFQLSVCILLVALLCQMLRRYLPEYAMLVTLGAGKLILLLNYSVILPIFRQVEHLFALTHLPESYAAILLKTLGICLITQFASDACRDVGETSLAGKIEFAAKVSMLLLALPLFSTVLTVVSSLVD